MKATSSGKFPFGRRRSPPSMLSVVVASVLAGSACAPRDRQDPTPPAPVAGDAVTWIRLLGGDDLRRECAADAGRSPPDHYRLLVAAGGETGDSGDAAPADRGLKVYDIRSLSPSAGALVRARTLALSPTGEVVVGPDDRLILTAIQFRDLRRHLLPAFGPQGQAPATDAAVWAAGGCHDGHWFFAVLPLSTLPDTPGR